MIWNKMSSTFRIFNSGIAAVLLIATASWASGNPSFTINGSKVNFIHDESRHLTISANCKSARGFHCMAYEALKKVSSSKIRPRSRHGRNPGAAICTFNLHAKLVVGTDSKGNERSFCLFSDDSMIANGTLAYYGRKTGS